MDASGSHPSSWAQCSALWITNIGDCFGPSCTSASLHCELFTVFLQVSDAVFVNKLATTILIIVPLLPCFFLTLFLVH